MKFIQSLVIFSIMLIFLITPVKQLKASDNMGANFFFDEVLRSYNNGNVRDAIHEWSKVLMIDPNHKEAKKHLRKLGVEKGLYTGNETQETRIADLERKIEYYKNQVAQLQNQ